MMLPRQASVKISCPGSMPELGKKIEAHMESFTYTDVAGGQSDSVSVTLSDIGKEWIGNQMPERGAVFAAGIVRTDWYVIKAEHSFECGTFVLDDISFSGRPLSCVLGGVSVPVMEDFKSLAVSNTWEQITLEEIAASIAAKAGVPLYYEADTVQIAEIEQSRQTDSAFLYSLCDQYGMKMKVYNHKLVIYDPVKYEERDPIMTIWEKDMLSWSCNTTVEGTYTGVNLDYTDPDADETVSVTMGEPGRMYSINSQASSRYDAELQAAAKVNAANRSVQTMEVKILADTRFVASQCIQISDLGKLDGKYFIDKIVHSVGSGYTMKLSLHKVQPAIKVTAPVAVSMGGSRSYTVVKGDTLWAIAKSFYGTGAKYGVIYDANADLIESTAKSHGKKSSENGHWIWPGEVLTIPEG